MFVLNDKEKKKKRKKKMSQVRAELFSLKPISVPHQTERNKTNIPMGYAGPQFGATHPGG